MLKNQQTYVDGASKLVGTKRPAQKHVSTLVSLPIAPGLKISEPPTKLRCIQKGITGQRQGSYPQELSGKSTKSNTPDINTRLVLPLKLAEKDKLNLKSMVRNFHWPINKDIKKEQDFLELIYKPQILSYTFVSTKKPSGNKRGKFILPSLSSLLEKKLFSKAVAHTRSKYNTVCPFCQSSFVNRSNLNRHIKMSHMSQTCKVQQMSKQIEAICGRLSPCKLKVHIKYTQTVHAVESRLQKTYKMLKTQGALQGEETEQANHPKLVKSDAQSSDKDIT